MTTHGFVTRIGDRLDHQRLIAGRKGAGESRRGRECEALENGSARRLDLNHARIVRACGAFAGDGATCRFAYVEERRVVIPQRQPGKRIPRELRLRHRAEKRIRRRERCKVERIRDELRQLRVCEVVREDDGSSPILDHLQPQCAFAILMNDIGSTVADFDRELDASGDIGFREICAGPSRELHTPPG